MARPIRLHCGIEGCLGLGFVFAKDSDEDCQCGHKECFHHVGQAKLTKSVAPRTSNLSYKSSQQQLSEAVRKTFSPAAKAASSLGNPAPGF